MGVLGSDGMTPQLDSRKPQLGSLVSQIAAQMDFSPNFLIFPIPGESDFDSRTQTTVRSAPEAADRIER